MFVSDIHLDAGRAATTAAFLHCLAQHATRVDALYLLGDIFEYWAGDDDLDAPEHAPLLAQLQALQAAGVALYWIAGNRDFLAGAAFAARCGLTLLPESWLLQAAGQRILLAHGDAACTDDHAYMAFRAQARSSAWQQAFLAQPLAQRKALIAQMRAQSMAAQRQQPAAILDVNQAAIDAMLDAADCQIMLHGHTHRPAIHRWQQHGQARERHVLPDWEADHSPPRGGFIRLEADGRLTHWQLQQP